MQKAFMNQRITAKFGYLTLQSNEFLISCIFLQRATSSLRVQIRINAKINSAFDF